MNIKTELLNENILKITSKRTLPFSVITNILFIIIFFISLYAFHNFIESYQEVSIGIIKDKNHIWKEKYTSRIHRNEASKIIYTF